MERLLIYSQDGMGLGHLRRTRNIAREVLTWKPGCILILADSPVVPFFSPLGGVDYLKLPTIIKTGDVTWQSSILPLNISETVNLRAKVIRQVFREFKPDVVLVDHMPVGAWGNRSFCWRAVYSGRDTLGFFLVCGMCWTPPR